MSNDFRQNSFIILRTWYTCLPLICFLKPIVKSRLFTTLNVWCKVWIVTLTDLLSINVGPLTEINNKYLLFLSVYRRKRKHLGEPRMGLAQFSKYNNRNIQLFKIKFSKSTLMYCGTFYFID